MKIITVSGPVLGLIFKNSLYSGVFSMLSSLIIVPLVSLISGKTRPAGVEQMFSCYDTNVTVQAKNVLADSEE